MTIFKTTAGDIGPGSYWVCFHDCFMYVEDTLPALIWLMLTEGGHDRHMVG